MSKYSYNSIIDFYNRLATIWQANIICDDESVKTANRMMTSTVINDIDKIVDAVTNQWAVSYPYVIPLAEANGVVNKYYYLFLVSQFDNKEDQNIYIVDFNTGLDTYATTGKPYDISLIFVKEDVFMYGGDDDRESVNNFYNVIHTILDYILKDIHIDNKTISHVLAFAFTYRISRGLDNGKYSSDVADIIRIFNKEFYYRMDALVNKEEFRNAIRELVMFEKYSADKNQSNIIRTHTDTLPVFNGYMERNPSLVHRLHTLARFDILANVMRWKYDKPTV